jgi:hypothetical protein
VFDGILGGSSARATALLNSFIEQQGGGRVSTRHRQGDPIARRTSSRQPHLQRPMDLKINVAGITCYKKRLRGAYPIVMVKMALIRDTEYLTFMLIHNSRSQYSVSPYMPNIFREGTTKMKPSAFIAASVAALPGMAFLGTGLAQATTIPPTISTTLTISTDSHLTSNVSCTVTGAPCIKFGANGTAKHSNGL